jgi:hypothetical protein
MAKRRRPGPPPTSQTPASSRGASVNWKTPLAVFLALALAAVPFAYGKYLEFNSPGPYDSGAYVHSAYKIVSGAQIGVDEKPSAKLGTLLVNMLGVSLFGYSETGPKIIQTLLQIAALTLMFFALRSSFGMLAAGIGIFLASFFLSAPLFAKFGNVKEQYMIAFMVIGISALVLRSQRGHWLWAVLAGAFLFWAPLFKETGLSALIAAGLFVLLQPLLKNSTWKQTGRQASFILIGAILSVGPVFVWLAVDDVKMAKPYGFLTKYVVPKKASAGADKAVDKAKGDYITESRKAYDFSEQFAKVFRFYKVLILPITLSLGAIILRIVRLFRRKATGDSSRAPPERYVLLFAIWWLLDMSFVWISPRSYEQYYLPLSASAAMLGGYLIYLYVRTISTTRSLQIWGLVGLAGFAFAMVTIWPLIIGLKVSPFTNRPYGSEDNPKRDRGFVQRFDDVDRSRQYRSAGQYGPRDGWIRVGHYIRDNSSEDDTIFVWGWFPGVYVQAQRLSASPRASEGNMHVDSPARLARKMRSLLKHLKQNKPKFIVDSRKNHFPWNRPPLPLWPIQDKGLLPPGNPALVKHFDDSYAAALTNKIGADEAQRYQAMALVRAYIMENYTPIRAKNMPMLVFQLK